MLCSNCRISTDNWNTTGHDTSAHHATVDSLLQAMHGGCYVCSEIAEDLQERLNFPRDSFNEPLLYQRIVGNRFIIFLNHRNGVGSDRWVYNAVDSLATPFTFGPKRLIWPYKIPRSMRSPTVGALANAWLQQCLQSHKSCEHRGVQSAVPLRVLDVSFDSPHLTLLDGPVEFAALSHCWGIEPFLTLHQDRISSYQRDGFSLETLPRNFRDAIQVCRWLNIRYLWIDSLCIVQGKSPAALADWSYHVQFMGRIYAAAIVCISTAATPAAVYSCLRDRDPRTIEPAELTISGQSHLLISQTLATRGFRNSHVSSRAWVLQERLFSRRILTIGRQQLFWECNETHGLNACETFPQGLDCSVMSRGPFSLPEILTQAAFRSRASAYLNWIELVETYSQCQLTCANDDKLAAFSGIAEAVGTLVGSPPYVAGFFAPEFPHALEWSIQEEHVPQSRPKMKSGVFRAPSWSWAATDAPVCLARWPGSAEWTTYAQLVAHSCIPTGTSNVYGQLLHAEITIRASLVPFTWEEDDDFCNIRFLDPFTGTSAWPFTVYHTPKNSIAMDCLNDRTAHLHGCYFLPIISALGVTGIIVRPAELPRVAAHRDSATKEKTFMRIGMFYFYNLDILDAFNPVAAEELVLV